MFSETCVDNSLQIELKVVQELKNNRVIMTLRLVFLTLFIQLSRIFQLWNSQKEWL